MNYDEPFLIKDLNRFTDNRGSFCELYKKSFYQKKYNLNTEFVQDNHSISKKNTIRGMHYQWDQPMDKLVRVFSGKILDIVINISIKSKNFGKVFYYELSDENNYQLFIPSNFAHGFISLTDYSHLHYKCSAEYNKDGESGINPFDSDLNINWGCDISQCIISDKDKNAKSLKEYILNPKF